MRNQRCNLFYYFEFLIAWVLHGLDVMRRYDGKCHSLIWLLRVLVALCDGQTHWILWSDLNLFNLFGLNFGLKIQKLNDKIQIFSVILTDTFLLWDADPIGLHLR